jgi:galactokinase
MSHLAFEAEVAAVAEIPRNTGAHEFDQAFHALPQAEAQAPGHIALLGEQADWTDGLALVVALPQQTRVSMRRNGDSHFRLHAAELGEVVAFTLDAPRPQQQFASYVYGCLRLASEEGADLQPLDIHVASDVPPGAGLCATAALEVATLRCLRELLGLEMDDLRIAQLAQQAGIQDAGVRCGILNPLAASLLTADDALLLDLRACTRRTLAMPPDSAVLVLDSGVARAPSACDSNARRTECEEAARLLGVRALRDVEHLEHIEALPDLPRRRARHVFTENARVLQALSCAGDPQAFGALLNASHSSLRDDFEASAPAVDLLVDLLQNHPGVYGARLAGDGFGGPCVALCRSDSVLEVAHAVLERYAAAGQRGRLLVPVAA